jgi:transcription elongation factor Elf1
MKCSFCGDTDSAMCQRDRVNDSAKKIYFVECLSCGATGPDADSAEGAEKGWKHAQRS